MIGRMRHSLRRKKDGDGVETPRRPAQWEIDENNVRTEGCHFFVKYLGCVEVQQSRGIHVCEEAVKKLKSSSKKVRAVLFVCPEQLRLVDEDTKDLIMDQTIEKVSFCAPDPRNERAFSYICRECTTLRWLCHSFLARRDSGERLSHAVGCAFAECLERKRQRELGCSVTATFDESRTTFSREGSFRVPSATELARQGDAGQARQLHPASPSSAGIANEAALDFLPSGGTNGAGGDAPRSEDPAPPPPLFPADFSCPANVLPPGAGRTHGRSFSAGTFVGIAEGAARGGSPGGAGSGGGSPVASLPPRSNSMGGLGRSELPHAIPRRHAPLEELARQGSLRSFPKLQQSSPFKRQLSLQHQMGQCSQLNRVPEVEVMAAAQETAGGDALSSFSGSMASALAASSSSSQPPPPPISDPFLAAPMPRPPQPSGGGAMGWFLGEDDQQSPGYQPGRRRTPSEADRWLDEAISASRHKQQQQQQAAWGQAGPSRVAYDEQGFPRAFSDPTMPSYFNGSAGQDHQKLHFELNSNVNNQTWGGGGGHASALFSLGSPVSPDPFMPVMDSPGQASTTAGHIAGLSPKSFEIQI